MKLYRIFASIVFVLGAFLKAEDKKFVLLVYSKNNSVTCTKTIDSFLSQTYQNFRMIWFDDNSIDGTPDVMVEYHENTSLEGRCKLIRAQKSWGRLYSLYKTIHTYVNDDEICVFFEAGDTFAHNNALKKINEVYQNPKILMTYGNFRDSLGNKAHCNPYTEDEKVSRSFRDVEYRGVAPYTFSALMFKTISFPAFFTALHAYNDYFSETWEEAFFFPLIEKVSPWYVCIDEVLYIKKASEELLPEVAKERKIRQIRDMVYLRNGSPQRRLIQHRDITSRNKELSLGCVLFVQNNPELALQSLEMMAQNSGVMLGSCILVFYSDKPFSNQQRVKLEGLFKKVLYNEIKPQHSLFFDKHSRLTFPRVLNAIDDNYIFFMKENFASQRPEHFHTCLRWLTATGCAALCIGKIGRDYRVRHLYDCSPWNNPITMFATSLGMLRTVFPNVNNYRGVIIERDLLRQLAPTDPYFSPCFEGFISSIESTLRLRDIILATDSQM